MASFTALRRISFGDCDPSGIAYFPSYLNLLNGVVEAWWSSLGLPWRDLVLSRRIGLPTVHLDVDFVSPGELGDDLLFNLRVEKLGTKSLTLAHTVDRDRTRLWQARQVVVATSLDTRGAVDWPDDLRSAVTSFMETPDE
jgi:4-hydroxybenzoyl-CoA thioesterase